MDNPDIQRLVEQVNNDVALQARFKAISDKADFEALVSELGYDLTYADFTDAELSESELTEVAGGQRWGEILREPGTIYIDRSW